MLHIYLRAACPQQNPAGTYSLTTSGSTSRRMAELCTALCCRARERSRPQTGASLRSPSSSASPAFTPQSNAGFRAPSNQTRVARTPGTTYRGQHRRQTGQEEPGARAALPALRPGRAGRGRGRARRRERRGPGSASAPAPPGRDGAAPGRSVRRRELSLSCCCSSPASPPLPAPRGGAMRCRDRPAERR